MFQLPQSCRVFVAIRPSNKWGWPEILMNKSNFFLEQIIWQKSNEGVKESKQTPKPEIYIPDFMKSELPSNKELEKHTVDDVREILSKKRV